MQEIIKICTKIMIVWLPFHSAIVPLAINKEAIFSLN